MNVHCLLLHRFNFLKFQFPSNGKARVNHTVSVLDRYNAVVSIPFKREGTCEPLLSLSWILLPVSFQFPSNGKARVNFRTFLFDKNVGSEKFQFPSNGKARVNKLKWIASNEHGRVSIPFKREGTCEHARVLDRIELSGDVSIPFKREGTCELRGSDTGGFGVLVSIPFKREGTCEPSNGELYHEVTVSFNSLQTGRHV